MPPSSPRPSHRHSESSPAIVFSTPDDHHQKPATASRLITSVRRTLSTAKRRDPTPSPMYSTPAERVPYTPSRFRYDPAAARPITVEEIAMGLHLSRTPHLRGGPPKAHGQPSQKSVPLPPPPARSSLKKPALPTASPSSTTDVTSISTPHSSDRSSASLRTRMTRFLPHTHRPGHHNPPSTPSSSTSELPRKKAVRFSGTVEEED
ncbi:hypothetical protein C8R43DRAFT_1000386 [Mycena crocata]|nr:hypothetical protein C8R43DRAFT_1000386 [Mycena crocata]